MTNRKPFKPDWIDETIFVLIALGAFVLAVSEGL